MYIEIRKRGKRKLYYLAHSFRHNGRVRKIRKYLGADLAEERIKALRKQGENTILEQIAEYKEIRNPLHTVLSQTEKETIKTLIAKDAIQIDHLSEEDWLKFTELFTYDTNAIEGSTITVLDVKDIIEKDEWPANTSKEEIAETYGVVEAVNHIREIKEHFSLELIKELHRIVFKNSKDFAGKFRCKGMEVVVADSRGNVVHRGAPPQEIQGLLKELITWYGENKDNYHPIVLSGVVHNQFENIHPFQDGNGRVGRLLLNNILLKHDMPPVNIELKNRLEYYSALQAYETHGNLRPTIELILKEYRKLKKILKSM